MNNLGKMLSIVMLLRLLMLTSVGYTESVNVHDVSLTVVPPGPVSDQIEVELRLAVWNHKNTECEFMVTIWWDDECPEHVLVQKNLTLAPDSVQLVQVWWPTTAQVGEHVIRYRVQENGAVAKTGQWPLQVMASETPALPWLQGGWLEPLGLSNAIYPRNREVTEADIHEMVAHLKIIGMNTLIIAYVEYFGHFFYPSDVRFFDRDVDKEASMQWFNFDVVDAILAEADRQEMHVFLGLGRGGDTELLWGGSTDTERLRVAIETSTKVANELWQRYNHRKSLYGWYLSHEMDDLAAASAYYDPVADFLHSLSPDKPVMVAPAGTPIMDNELISRSHVDIFAYQDAVGAGFMPGVYTWNPENRITQLDEVFKRYAGWHRGTRKHIWADLEIWQMDGPSYANPYPAASDRVERQIALEAPHVEMLTAYEVIGNLQAPDSALQLKNKAALQLYIAFNRLYEKAVVSNKPVTTR